jgi:hypothetical protein
MIALNCCAWAVQLQEARQNLQRRNRHGRAPLRDAISIERKIGVFLNRTSSGQYTFPIAAEMWSRDAAFSVKLTFGE